jgi:hypothetical protein
MISRTTHGCGHPIFVSDFRTKHVPYGFLISKRDFITGLDKIQSSVSDELEA